MAQSRKQFLTYWNNSDGFLLIDEYGTSFIFRLQISGVCKFSYGAVMLAMIIYK